jgi:hypothetical protein
MKNLPIQSLFLILLLLSFFSTAYGSIDINNYSCQEYLSTVEKGMKSKEKNARIGVSTLMTWLYGYAAAQRKSGLFDTNEFRQVFTTLGNECEKNPKTQVIKAIHNSWSKASKK